VWTEYIKEREGAEVLSFDFGFAVVKHEEGFCLYLQDVYIKPEFRKQGYGRKIVEIVEASARSLGLKKIVTSCCPTAIGSTDSILAILACGFQLQSCADDIIYLDKEL
jgi:GNAT superfamily N-acetyltransferase